MDRRGRVLLVQLGVVLAAMNVLFYLAVARLPLATVAAIEFLGVVLLATAGSGRHATPAALALTVGGVAALADLRLAGQPLGFAFAFGNCALFMLYVVLGHRVANTDAGTGAMSGIDQLGAAMLVAAVVVTPVGLGGALAAFAAPGAAAGGRGRGRVLLGDPLRHRPAGNGEAAPRQLRPDAGAAARCSARSSARSCCASSPPARIWWASRWSSPASRCTRSRPMMDST